MNFSVIVPSYKDVGIEKLVHKIMKSKTGNFELDKVIMVVCGYDKLPNFGNKVMVIKERERCGKAYAINLGLKKVKSDIVVIVNGDLLLTKNSISEILKPFNDSKTGMVGGRAIPINDKSNAIGFIVHLIWTLHHFVSMESPKLGEIIAFRNIIKSIDRQTATDEASIELEIKNKGFSMAYAPEAIVNIKGPETLSDLVKQRKRIFIGHLHLRKTKNYTVSTMNMWLILKVLMRFVRMKPKKIHIMLLACLLEFYIRCLAVFEYYILKKNPYKWEIIETAKFKNQ